MRIDKYDSADVRVYKYDLPSNGTSSTATTGVEEERISLTTTTGVDGEITGVDGESTNVYVDEEDFGSSTQSSNTQFALDFEKSRALP